MSKTKLKLQFQKVYESTFLDGNDIDAADK